MSERPAETRTVSRCGECPFRYVGPFDDYCLHDDVPKKLTLPQQIGYEPPDPPPEWCPLREQDVLLRYGGEDE